MSPTRPSLHRCTEVSPGEIRNFASLEGYATQGKRRHFSPVFRRNCDAQFSVAFKPLMRTEYPRHVWFIWIFFHHSSILLQRRVLHVAWSPSEGVFCSLFKIRGHLQYRVVALKKKKKIGTHPLQISVVPGENLYSGDNDFFLCCHRLICTSNKLSQMSFKIVQL